jgi:hypothetical protein
MWNPRERILTLLQGNQPDCVPWFGDLDYWVSAMERRGELASGFRSTPAYLDFHEQLKVGFYLQGYWPFKTHYDETVMVKKWQEGNLRKGVIQTPIGNLSEVWTYLEDSFSEAPTKRFVETVEDLKVLRYVFDHTSYSSDYVELKRRQVIIGDRGVLLAYLPRSPFMQMVTELSSLEALVYLWSEAPEVLDDTLRVMAEKHDQAAELALSSPAECLMIPENLSSELIGKRFFELYLRPYETKWVAKIRETGKYSFIHMDGTLRGLIREVSTVGFDVIEAVTPAPVGDLTLEEMRSFTGEKQILWGGIPGLYFTDLVSDKEFDKLVSHMVELMRQSPRYVLGVADQVPPDGSYKRVARVAEIVSEFGIYP